MQPHLRAALFAALLALAAPAAADAATKSVTAGPPLTAPPAGVPEYSDAPQFFPSQATVHVGDSVKWGFFGFHNVYFPKKGGGNAPLLIPDATRKYAENDPAGNPFWFNGQNQFVGNPVAAFPAGGKTENGTKANNSGLPESEKFSYKLKFTKAGTFTYFCTIHANMKGTVKVLSKAKKVPTSKADKAAVKAQIAKAVAKLKADNTRADAAGNVVEAGRDSRGSSLLAFFPAKKTVPVGTTVDFKMSPVTNEIHTVTFGTPAIFAKDGYAEKIEQATLSPLPGTGTNGPPVLGMPGALFFPSDPGALSFDGTQHGGFFNAGLIGGSPTPLPKDTNVTFTKAGSYDYICLIHPDMKGQIVVQ